MPGFVRAVAIAERSLLGRSLTRQNQGVAAVDEARRAGLRVVLLSDRSFEELSARGDVLLPHFDGVIAESGAAVKVGAGPVRRVSRPARGALVQVLEELDVDPHDALGIAGSSADAGLLGALEVAVRAGLRVGRPVPRQPGRPAGRQPGRPVGRQPGRQTGLQGARQPRRASWRGADYGVPGPGAVALRRVLDDARAGLPAASPRRHDVTVPAVGRRGVLHVPGAHANVVVCAAAPDEHDLPRQLVTRWTGAGYSSVVIDLEQRHREGQAIEAADGAWLDDFRVAIRTHRAPVVLGLAGLGGRERSCALSLALAAVRARRARSGRPHWLVIDAAEPVLTDPDLPPEAFDLAATGHCLVLREHRPVPTVRAAGLHVVLGCGPECPVPAAHR